MKKILLFSVFFSIIIGIFHHPIIAFSHAENIDDSHSHFENNIEYSHENHNKASHINHKSGEEHFHVTRNNVGLSNKIIKVIYKFSYFDLEVNEYFLLEKHNFVHITSPTILNRKIKFYSYGDLIKIVKSNT